MAYNLSRMTIYALICAVEFDLRALLKSYLGSLQSRSEDFDQILIARAKERLEKDGNFKYESSIVNELIDYFDLGDTFQTVNSNSSKFPNDVASQIKRETKALEKLVSIRNRVMHIRPLDFDDLPFVSDFCMRLVQDAPMSWSNVAETIEKLHADPSHVLGLRINSFDDTESIFHNLPLPDFDETGLIGRDATVKQVVKLCRGSFPVISIVGEGGVGKTALALKVAYELLEEKNLFDAVVWVTSKTTQISINEIRDIKGAITTSVGVVQEISEQLGGKATDNPLEEISEYLSTFKVALFLDNLETILDDRIREFVSTLPMGSKLIITSRIGLGAFEYPVKLSGIEEAFASKLIRTLAKLRNIPVLAQLDEAVLRRYANRMHLSPGYIKWFVSAVQTGIAPETVLQNSDLFLEFCMSNVYNHLSDDARVVTGVLQCMPGWRDLAELAYLAQFEAIQTQKALQELMATNMLSENTMVFGNGVKTTYQISELPKAYLNKYQAPSKALRDRIMHARNKLNAQFDSYPSGSRARYVRKNIVLRIKNDRVIIKMLSEAFRCIEDNNYNRSYELLKEAQRLAPDFFEVHRLLGYFHQKKGNMPEARAGYELAIDLAQNTPQLHYWYGCFLLRDEESHEEALTQFEIAKRLDPESPETTLELARIKMFQKKYTESRAILEKFLSEYGKEDRFGFQFAEMRFQLYYREADLLATLGEYDESLSKLQLMKSEFLSMKKKFSDIRKVVKRLPKAAPTISLLLRNSNSYNRSKLLEMQSWIQSF